VIKDKHPNATVDEIENAFKSTGKPITVEGVTRQRIDIDKALEAMGSGSICQASLGLSKGKWKMISLPCKPPSDKNTVADIFGDDGLGTYDTNWVVFSFDNSLNPSNYKKEALTAKLEQGKGYWIIATTENATLKMPEGSMQTPTSVAANSAACMSNKGCFEIPLSTKAANPEWNLLGNPYLSPGIAVSELRIVTDAATSPNNCGDANGCTLDEAEADGVFHNELWNWRYSGNPAKGAYSILTMANNVEAWMAYWSVTLKNAPGTNPRLLVPNKAP
jgi:hypothetical protein